MAKHKTRKDRRLQDVPSDWPKLHYRHICRGKRDLKKQTRIRSRRRSIEDETPYKRLDDPWYYC